MVWRTDNMRICLIALVLVACRVASAGPLAQAINSAAARYKVDAKILHAIAYLESSGGKRIGLKANTNGTFDVGAFQINSVHWATTCRYYDVTTLQGNAYCAALLLAKHKRYKDIDLHWVGRYHSRTPSLKQKYAKKIKVFLANSDK